MADSLHTFMLFRSLLDSTCMHSRISGPSQLKQTKPLGRPRSLVLSLLQLRQCGQA